MKYTVYEVNFELIEPILGTVPKDPDVYTRYIAGKRDKNGNLLIPDEKMIAEEVSTVPDPADELEKSGWTGFHQDQNGLFLYNYVILGFIKEAGNVLKSQLGIASLRSKIDQFVFVEPRRIYLGKNKPDGYIERPLRAMTQQGPRVTVVRSDYVDAGTKFTAKLILLDNYNAREKKAEITADVLREILSYGRFRGLGQFRNGSYGRFVFEMAELRGKSIA